MLHLAASLPRSAAGRFKKPVLGTGTENYFSPAILFALGLAVGAILALLTSLPAGVPAIAGVVLAAGIAVAWRGPDRYRRFALLTAVLAAGLLAGQMRTDARIAGAAAIPAIDTRDNVVPLTGWLGAIERSGSGRTAVATSDRRHAPVPPPAKVWRVARRWRISPVDAAELIMNVQRAELRHRPTPARPAGGGRQKQSGPL